MLVSRGAWAEAEAELAAATQELGATRPAMAVEALVRLAELRRRQGRLEEAAALFEQVAVHPLARLGLAELALDRGDPAAATDLAGRFLRAIPKADRTERAGGLELLVRAQVHGGDLPGARQALADLLAVAESVGTRPLRALAWWAQGLVEVAAGRLTAGQARLEDAADAYARSGAPYEAARARLELAGCLHALGQHATAEWEAAAARDALVALGAAHEAARAAVLGGQPAPAHWRSGAQRAYGAPAVAS